MTPGENINERLKSLPHMTEEHISVLNKHGISTPEKLLEAINDTDKWKSIHAEMKGVGPKTVEKWKSTLESGQSLAGKPTEAAKPQAQVARVARQVKKPAETPKVAPVEKKPTPEPQKVAAPEVKPEPQQVKPAEKKPEPEKAKAPAKEAAKPKAEKVKKAEKKKEEESVEVVEEGGYVPNKKAKLSPEVIDALKKRGKIAETRPEFTRQEYGRRLRLQATGWRKPRGIHSKTRYKMRYRRPMVSIGYAGPSLSKNLHPSGFREVQVFNVNDLSKISDSDQQAARISHGVGRRKRELIIKKADELGIRILNRR